jgi:hypothetical protein|tara:strand:+ start:3667 stop:4296 length:630 start_codon:yes stop_codon:yes gene_type:complete
MLALGVMKEENNMKTIDTLIENYSYEDLAHAMYLMGERDGAQKITDKTQWREFVIAEKLGHKAFDKISAGKGSDKYGADAYEADGQTAEYKSKAINDKEVRNLTRQIRNHNTGLRFSALKVPGVYNGAYTQDAIDAYSNHNHYFGVFWKEKCVLIIKPHTDYVIDTLTENNNNRKEGATTNLNSVVVDLEDASTYEIVFKDENWFEENS